MFYANNRCNTNMGVKIVFSCQADFRDIALQEILNLNTSVKFSTWIDNAAGIVEYTGTFNEFSVLIQEKQLIFIRHIFPVEYIIPLQNRISYADVIDIIEQSDFIQNFISRMDKNKNFSLQIRTANNDKSYESSKIKEKISNSFKSEGFIENKRYPEQIISMFISNDLTYIGLSYAEENLSIWSGGMRHYSVRNDTISRAEFKLMEALEAYPVVFDKNSIALDLGAAPGGWTKVLIEHGLKVVAVDPDQLSPVLKLNKNVEFYNGRAQDYIRESNIMFDLIVNDMRMDIMASISLMLSMKEHLHDNGYFIITLKLKKHDRLKDIKNGIKRLRKELDIVFIKQLFHNRSEITVILQKK